MPEKKTHNDLEETIVQLTRRLQPGGDLAPVKDSEEWDALVASKPPEERDLLQELARFVDLWRYFRERNKPLGMDIVDSIQGLNTLPVPKRIERLKEINLKLMERVGDDGSSAQSRH
jgi:hypothetical protein